MGLGQGFSGLRSRVNETASSLLTSTQTEHKKEVCIQIRIEEDKKLLFDEICKKRCTSKDKRGAMSAALRNFINNAIATDGTILSFKE